MSPGLFDGSLLVDAHPVLDFGEDLFDGIEVGRIGREIPEPCSGCADELANGGRLVRTEIVHDDDVAGLEHRHELLLDIGAEARSVDRSVEDARRGEAVEPQGAEEGQRAPMSVGRKAAQAFAAWSPTAQRSHVGLDPRLIDEDQLAGIEAGLKGAPTLPAACNVGARLLKGEQRFF